MEPYAVLLGGGLAGLVVGVVMAVEWLLRNRRLHSERPCQCGHLRCYHTEGRMGCNAGVKGQTFDGTPCYATCQCAHYIADYKPGAEAEVKALEELMRK